MAAFTYTNPTVGGSEDSWGTTLNANWDALGTFIGALDSTELAVLDGITATTAELNTLDGVTATTAELNILDGVTATTAELNYVDGVTSPVQAQIDAVSAAVSGVASVPSGTVIHVAMQTAPSGYLKADGTAVSRTTYAALFAAIGTVFGAGDGSTTFNLPDLRGEFVRGFDDARGVDSGRAFGSTQSDAVGPHSHPIRQLSGGFTQFAGDGFYTPRTAGASITTPNSTGSETRPRNVALLACIKV